MGTAAVRLDRTALLLLGCALLSVWAGSAAADLAMVTRSGRTFYAGSSKFVVHGGNFFPAMMVCSYGDRAQVSNVLTSAASLGLNVLRTWAFSDGPGKLQTAPGQFNEQTFRCLDFVIAEAAKNNIRVILPFVNNWNAYGGKAQYVAWSKQAGSPSSQPDDFYTDANTRAYYKKFVATLLNRRNTITGKVYKDDPAIFGWELMNEPRCESDPSGNTLQVGDVRMMTYDDPGCLTSVNSFDWEPSTAPKEKSIEHSGPSSTARYFLNPGSWASNTGSDFMRNHRVDQIDYLSMHFYADQWIGGTVDDKYNFQVNWVRGHVYDGSATRLNKPVVLGEFGYPISAQRQPSEFVDRNRFFQSVYQSVLTSAQTGGAFGGALYWQLGLNQYQTSPPNTYTVYSPSDVSTLGLISSQSASLKSALGQQ
ncbi:Glycoside hydrolase [Klebsormidium nitens]|uniref:mannan endo-1,4-beta-mannosidase n=1 Tax=Klebsormidium nitens TaxID=105231 RepID=A0A1Y1HWF4_KLENI|nr:Glycoside hydrolase [Klebsormidium nitens]|eukprot:GAQ82980.1 Glycoside hydrolase [Klebsormidium nitens]